MKINFPQIECLFPECLELCKIDNDRFFVAPPGKLSITQDERGMLNDLLEQLSRLAGKPVPELVRIDGIILSDGSFKVLEVNTDNPGGLGFMLLQFQAFGMADELARLTAHWSTIAPRGVLFIVEPLARISNHEAEAHKAVLPDVQTIRTNDPNLKSAIDAASQRGQTIFRLAGTADISDTLLLEKYRLTNYVGSNALGDKKLLAQIDSPLIPETTVRRFLKDEAVPSGFVAKLPRSHGGKGVFFPQKKVPESGEYCLQQLLTLPEREISGMIFKFGVDIFLFHGEIFCIGRLCKKDQELLNLSSGGGMMALELNDRL